MESNSISTARMTVTVPEAAERLGVGANTLYEAIARGDGPIRGIKVGRRVVISTAELDAVLMTVETNGAPAG